MHDTILLNKISEVLKETCIVNNIKRIDEFTVVVNHRSHVNENNLCEHLQRVDNSLIGDWTKINIEKEDIEDQTAILLNIKGEQNN